jgi:D-beta-D-heptose 7-phosphate kinase/D-beta-D-heptose 1-phosphate adenosyltransferase
MVLADGCFDPIHWGHIRYLSICAAFGDLAVRVAPDEEVLKKGRMLFQTREERMKTIAAIRPVSSIVDTEESLASTIYATEPDYLIKGADWRGRLPQDVIDACAETGTQILFVDEQTATSTERLQ